MAAGDPALLGLVTATSGGQGLVEALASQLLLHGNGYVQILTDGAGAAAELFALRPERVTVEADSRGWPVAYRYKAGGSMAVLPAEDGAGRPAVVHIKALHPLDDHYGAGCLAAAQGAIAAHNAAATWNAALLGNAARPSGALIHDPGDKGMPLSAEQVDRLREELAASFAGGAKAGRPLLLEGGLKWQAQAPSPAELEFLDLQQRAGARNGRPAGALIHDPGDKGRPLSAEQVDRLREELAESFAGGANAGRPLLLEGGLKWQALSLSPADMDFLELKHSAAREIAMAFGVPPMLLGLPGDATYANYREANRALWRLTVLPLCAKIDRKSKRLNSSH